LRLIRADEASLENIGGIDYRKVKGHAEFLHNGATLVCDSALWNVNDNIVEAEGNVIVVQKDTRLTAPEISYIVNENTARCHGGIVSLYDKDGNMLRTNNLDYDTKDSVAVFYNGGSLKGKDGNLIESLNGRYDAKTEIFSFTNNVQMFTDSAFISSVEMDYMVGSRTVRFGHNTRIWQKSNMLSANSGLLLRDSSIFIFDRDGHIITTDQELWADHIKYYREKAEAELRNNVQVLDTVNSALAFSDGAFYRKYPMSVMLYRKPSLAAYSLEKGNSDTLFMSADSIHLYQRRYCDIDTVEVSAAELRRKLMDIDPFAEREQKKKSPAETGEIVQRESRSAKDTAGITFADAWHNVKMYRDDFQGRCDSLVYTSLDSIARLYGKPILWDNIKNQMTSDSMQVLIIDNAISKADMLDNAFIASMEDSVHFDQVKGTEMTAFFKGNDIYRFDVLGGVSVIFFFREKDSVITIMNQKECKMMSALIEDRQINRIKYVEGIKDDAYPVYNLKKRDMFLRGYEWRADERPQNRREVCARNIKKSGREAMSVYPFPKFPVSRNYFPALRDSIINFRHRTDSLLVEAKLRKAMDKSEKLQPVDTSASVNIPAGIKALPPREGHIPHGGISDRVVLDSLHVSSGEPDNFSGQALRKKKEEGY
jgi:lipopolysaccharide export system protein LptA